MQVEVNGTRLWFDVDGPVRGFIAMIYAARHPGHAGALVLQSTCARFDLHRPVEGFRG